MLLHVQNYSSDGKKLRSEVQVSATDLCWPSSKAAGAIIGMGAIRIKIFEKLIYKSQLLFQFH